MSGKASSKEFEKEPPRRRGSSLRPHSEQSVKTMAGKNRADGRSSIHVGRLAVTLLFHLSREHVLMSPFSVLRNNIKVTTNVHDV